jgi:hypothetical protein
MTYLNCHKFIDVLFYPRLESIAGIPPVFFSIGYLLIVQTNLPSSDNQKRWFAELVQSIGVDFTAHNF